MSKMKIEIWSDIACPYCYIGKRKLEMALARFDHKDDVELVWHSYQLDPSLPKVATNKSFYQYFADKYNMSIDQAMSNQQGVINIAKEVGLEYNYDKLIMANTGDALRLVKLAAESNLATEAEEVIFKAYFTEGKDISDRATLIALGTSIGLKAQDIEQMLDSDKYLQQIQADMDQAEQEFNLEYIPFYRLNNNQIIQGSISIDDYLKTLESAYKEWKTGTTSDNDIITGQSCSIDGVCS